MISFSLSAKIGRIRSEVKPDSEKSINIIIQRLFKHEDSVFGEPKSINVFLAAITIPGVATVRPKMLRFSWPYGIPNKFKHACLKVAQVFAFFSVFLKNVMFQHFKKLNI